MAESDDDKTVEPVVPKASDDPPVTPPTPPAPPAEDDSLRDEVASLKEIVVGLAETVASLAPLPSDETPTAKPWTHRTFG